MGSSILGVGQSALAAAQAGLVTTGHNIANASTPGYSRQMVIQGSAGSQDAGFGFVGKGTTVTDVKRVFNDLLASQVRSAETTKNQVETYYAQISRINNQLADPDAGLSPALQDFFKGVQDMAANPSAAASRQTVLSTAQTLAARFQSLSGQLSEVMESVNGQIQSSVSSINVYAKQIATLNDAIEKAQGNGEGKASNDLLDQRDLAVTELSKEVKTTVVKQGNSYNVFVGNGQPLVVGAQPYNLVSTSSTTDPGRSAVGYVSDGTVITLPESSLPGGKLGGLLEFRANSLDSAQNSLGRIAIGLAMTFNAQHALGVDLSGAAGGDFFTAADPRVDRSSTNAASSDKITASISNPDQLSGSDYRVKVVGSNFVVTRLSNNENLGGGALGTTFNVEGVDIDTSGTYADGDEFVVRPTVDGASNFRAAISDVSKIAAAAPILAAAAGANKGSGKISAGSVNSGFTSASAAALPVSLTYNAGSPNTLTGFPATMAVTVTNGTSSTTFAAGAPVTYTDGATISFGGMSFVVSGSPADGDTFTISPNTSGVTVGDGRNAVALGLLQSGNTLGNGTTSYQGAYSQLVSAIGNKTRELEVTSNAESRYLEQANAANQAESGVNLDEEATNLMRYQQAYQAAAKVMQTASQLFDLLLNLGT
ncbi:flagellar hook-associated protein FlgK [Herbaspirillum sp. ST 5-3]|uniref:flagellar hook-associated protein FlgK n=1 Tax=Oxalobacteraceae TaxID=75682 RepID=UPI0010A39981|nr:flagellar hook-associated protein FlgK [Herbaspirillum sp. ST 5-3]